jgi:alginate O-acetyltransferase complex protein AlgI
LIVPSFFFLVFAVVAAVIYNISVETTWRAFVMLCVNFLFLASFSREPLTFAPFFGFLVVGYLAIPVIEISQTKLSFFSFVLPPVIIPETVLIFVWLKQYSFIPKSLLLEFPYVTVGLSYVFFRVMHLVIDAAQGKVQQRLTVLDYANYTLNFLCLISGPILR